ncbi:hypothetical protein B0H12DRAFT_1059809, partial [Mycena haematopus]
MYSARVEGRKSNLTVAMYQGNRAEEEWRQDVAKYMSMRHPNMIQMWGAASSNGIHATLFNDDLIPLQQFLDYYQDFPILTVYIYTSCNEDFSKVVNYIHSTIQQTPWSQECVKWIHCATGRLCAELGSSDFMWLTSTQPAFGFQELYALGASHCDSHIESINIAAEALTLRQYHEICRCNLQQHRHIIIPASTPVNLGAVFFYSSTDSPEHLNEIASFNLESYFDAWVISGGVNRVIINGGWTRFQCSDIVDHTVTCNIGAIYFPDAWLSQANSIFHCLHIVSNFDDYVWLYEIQFWLSISRTTGNPPTGFLFLCPPEHFGSGPSSFCWPACTAYWSLDPSGIDHISLEDATQLGFPSLQLTTIAKGGSWDTSVYKGLHQFHQAKGFDPESQDIAQHLGLPLYHL